MNYNFDEIISREGTNSINFDGWKPFLLQKDKDDQLPFADEDHIRMWIADMDFETPKPILDAIRARLDRRILGYTQVFDPSYFETMERWHRKKYNWEFHRDQLVFSPGIVQALSRLVGLLTAEHENILIHTPSYAPFQKAGDLHGRKVFHSPLVRRNGAWEVDFEDMERQLDDASKNIRLFIFCSPHNPTGRLWTTEELHKLGTMCLKRNIWLISDEVHCDLLRTGKQHQPIARLFPENDRIITLMAPSKTFNLAGNLLSHIFIPNNGIRERWQYIYGDSLSPLSVEATKAAYGACEDWLEALKIYLDDNFALLKSKLDEHLPLTEFSIPDSTYLAWIDLTAYIDRVPASQSLIHFFAERAGILIEDETMFVANGEGHIRMNIACPRTVLEQGIDRLISALEQAKQ